MLCGGVCYAYVIEINYVEELKTLENDKEMNSTAIGDRDLFYIYSLFRFKHAIRIEEKKEDCWFYVSSVSDMYMA